MHPPKAFNQFIAFLTLSLIASGPAKADPLVVDKRPALPIPLNNVALFEQCGTTDDLQDVELYDGTRGVTQTFVETNEPSTVQLQWIDESQIKAQLPGYSPGNVAGARWCSGTLIAERHLLTAGHCLDIQEGQHGWTTPFTIDGNGMRHYAPPDVLATLQKANFKYQRSRQTKQVREPEVYPVIRLLEPQWPRMIDYAVVELGQNTAGEYPGKRFAPAKTSVRPIKAKETVAIIQHPNGSPKKVDAGRVLASNHTEVLYDDIDTHGGSSGSGVRDTKGNVVAVHTNGGCQADANANKGVSLEYISKTSKIIH